MFSLVFFCCGAWARLKLFLFHFHLSILLAIFAPRDLPYAPTHCPKYVSRRRPAAKTPVASPLNKSPSREKTPLVETREREVKPPETIPRAQVHFLPCSVPVTRANRERVTECRLPGRRGIRPAPADRLVRLAKEGKVVPGLTPSGHLIFEYQYFFRLPTSHEASRPPPFSEIKAEELLSSPQQEVMLDATDDFNVEECHQVSVSTVIAPSLCDIKAEELSQQEVIIATNADYVSYPLQSSPSYVTCDTQPLPFADCIMDDQLNDYQSFAQSHSLLTLDRASTDVEHDFLDSDVEHDFLDSDVDDLCLAILNLKLRGDAHSNPAMMMEVDGISYALGRLALDIEDDASLATCETPVSADLTTAYELIRTVGLHPLEDSEALAAAPDSTEAPRWEHDQEPDSTDCSLSEPVEDCLLSEPLANRPESEPDCPESKPRADHPSGEPAASEPVPDCPASEDPPSSKPVTDGPVSEPVLDGPVSESLQDGPVSKRVTDGPVSKPVTDGPVDEPLQDGPASEPVLDSSSCEPKADVPSSEALAESEALADHPESEPVASKPVVDSPPGEQAAKCPPGATVADRPPSEPLLDCPASKPVPDYPQSKPVASSKQSSLPPVKPKTARQRLWEKVQSFEKSQRRVSHDDDLEDDLDFSFLMTTSTARPSIDTDRVKITICSKKKPN